MAPSIASGFENLQETLDDSAEGQKLASMVKDTKDYHEKNNRITTDYGVTQTNKDTYTLTNAKGERLFVKFYFTPQLGVHGFVWDKTLKLAGQDPDFHRKDLQEAIDKALCSTRASFLLVPIPSLRSNREEGLCTGEAVDFVKDACSLPGMDFSTTATVLGNYGVVTAFKVKPESFEETLKMAKEAIESGNQYCYEISCHKNFEREMKGFS